MNSRQSKVLQARRSERISIVSLRYGWWMGRAGRAVKKAAPLLGYRLSRSMLAALGCPSGALAWPLGLAYWVLNAYRDTGTIADIPNWIEKSFRLQFDNDGHPINKEIASDMGVLGYAALGLFERTHDPRYLEFAHAIGNALADMPGYGTGAIPYALGRNEVLVDTVAFVCPFLARLARIDSSVPPLSAALSMQRTVVTNTEIDGQWPYHGYDQRTMQPLGIAGWGRGIAWLLVGTIDLAAEMPDCDARNELITYAAQVLHRLASCQLDSGHWPWCLTDAFAQEDSSVTALVLYAMARFDQCFTDAPLLNNSLEKAARAIDNTTTDDGWVTNCSGEVIDLGIYSDQFSSYLWALAPAVAAFEIMNSAGTRNDAHR